MSSRLAYGVQLNGVNAASRKLDRIKVALAVCTGANGCEQGDANEGQKHATDGLLKAKGCTG